MFLIPIGNRVKDLTFVFIFGLGTLIPNLLEEEVAHRDFIWFEDLGSLGGGSVG